MIHVDAQPEPANFDAAVRKPGLKFLRTCPKPKTNDWAKHDYWAAVRFELHELYGGICAYSCHWISYDTGARTVEHFKPKGKYPKDAYEWSNYRLVCSLLNSRKRTRETILDPFLIHDGWFTIEFPSLLVKPASNLNKRLSKAVQRTIDQLKLNDEDTCMKSRAKYVEHYCKREVTLSFLEQDAPFIAFELERQDLIEAIRSIMIY